MGGRSAHRLIRSATVRTSPVSHRRATPGRLATM